MSIYGNFRVSFMTASSVFVGGSLLLAAQPAQADHGHHRAAEFRMYRQQNPDMGKHEMRQMFNADRSNGSTTLTSVVTQDGNGYIRCGTETPKFDHVRSQSMQVSDAGNVIRLNTGVDLDLSSQTRNITLGKNLFSAGDSVTITVGGESKTLSAGSQVSAAEYVAAKQVLSGSAQQISIDKAGKATGGDVDLGALTSGDDRMRAASLVVAENVTTYGDFGRHSDFRLLGDLNNFGTVHALSSDNNVRGGVIGAHDITNHAGALISSDVDLSLEASGNLSNAGTISSNGSLTLSAGGSINNRGTLQSRNGDINLNAPGDLSVNNAGGTISALNGAINVRSSDYTGAFNSTIYGGDLLSRELNLNSGQGLSSIAVNQLTGVLNGTGNAAHVLASTDVLNLGAICLSGDPTFYNSTGSINIGADIAATEDLVIVASGNITSNSSVTLQAGDTNTGFNITMIAGADFVASSGTDSPTLPPLTGAGSVSLSGKASSTGGSIIMGASTNILARSSDFGTGNDNGGNVEMFAFAGKQAGSGVIDINDTTVASHGFGTGLNRDILLVAGAKDTNAVLTGQLNTFSGAGSGNVTIVTAQPVSSDKKFTIDYSATGVHTGSNLVAGSKLSKGADIVFTVGGSGVINLSGNGSFTAGNDILIDQAQIQNVSGGVVNFTAGSDVRATVGTTSVLAGTININAGGDIGSQANAFPIDTSTISAIAKGDKVFLQASGAGALLVDSLSAKSEVHITAPGRTLSTNNDASAVDFIEFNAFDFGGFGISGIKGTFSITQTNAAGVKLGGGFGGFNQMIIDYAAGIGTLGTPLDTGNLGTVTATAPAVFLSSSGSKAERFDVTATTGNAEIDASGSVILGDINVPQGSLLAQTNSKTMTVEGDMNVRDGINIIHNGTSSSSKLVFDNNVVIQTSNKGALGAITITVGGPGLPADNQGPFDNVQINETGGQVVINGPGFKAKPSTNNLIALGADLTINNAFKAGNIAFNGGVTIQADPPVAPGTPTYTTVGPTRLFGQNSAISRVLDPAPSAVPAPEQVQASASVSNAIFTSDSALNLVSANAARIGDLNSSVANGDDSYITVVRPGQYEHEAGVFSDIDLTDGSYVDSSSNPSEGSSTGVKLADAQNLTRGSALFIPSRDTVVSTPSGRVKLSAGSIALISTDSNHLSVYDLHDESKGGVSIESEGKSISLSPGRHVSIAAKQVHSFAEVNPVEAVPHRGVSRQNLGNDKSLFQSEFSILSAADVVKPLKALLMSEKKDAKKVAGKMLKTAAVVMQLSGSALPFELHAKPAMVALHK